MATAHVQTKDAQSSSGTALGISLTGVVGGNHLVTTTADSWSSAALTLSTPTSSPTATWLASVPQINVGGVSGRMDHSENVASGAWTVTVHVSSLTELTGIVSESSGVATSSSLGAHSSGSAAGSTATVQPGSITPAAGSILYTAVTDSSGATAADTIDSSFTISSDATAWNGVNQRAGDAHKDNVAAVAVNPTWTCGGSLASGQVALIAEFKAAGVTVLPPPQASRPRLKGLYVRARRSASPPWAQGPQTIYVPPPTTRPVQRAHRAWQRRGRLIQPGWGQGSLATPVPAIIRRAPGRFYVRRGRLLVPLAPVVTLPPLANIRARINRSWQRRGKFVEPTWGQGSQATPVPQVVRRSPVRFYTRRGKLFEVQPGVVLLPPLAVINRRIHRTWQRRGKLTSPPWPQGSLDTPTPKVITRAPGRWYLRRGKLLFIPTPAVPYAPLPNLTRRVHRSWQRRGRTIEPTWAQGPRTQYVPVVTSRRAVRPYIIRRGKVLVPVKVASGAVVYVPLRMLMGMGF